MPMPRPDKLVTVSDVVICFDVEATESADFDFLFLLLSWNTFLILLWVTEF